MDIRNRLLGLIRVGLDSSFLLSNGIDPKQISDNSNKSILIRGCDPEMGRLAIELLTPVLGNPEIVAVTNDDEFIIELKKKKWSVMFFAPGACRFNSTNSPIPGSRPHTDGWGLTEYKALVKRHQGKYIKIVETTDETEIIHLLIKALS